MRDSSTGKDMLEGVEIDKANADKIMRFLIEKGLKVGLAESITAGGISRRLTEIPGSSKALVGGVVCYTRFSKEKLLGVPASLLDEQGTVSSDVALALAEGAMKLFEVDIGFGITGNAGPTADSDKSKVGQVHIAIASKDGERTYKDYDLFGTREDIRAKAITEGLRFIREFITNKYV
jgi:nicotinamide-nucleotide amidase